MTPGPASTDPDWTPLGQIAPTTLVGARTLAHAAVQWATRAARANLPPVSDDSHSSLIWDAHRGALCSQPLPARAKALTLGVALADLRLMVLLDGQPEKTLALDGQTDTAAGAWVDAQLVSAGLALASPVRLPYSIGLDRPPNAPYEVRGEAAALEALARWYRVASATLEGVRAALAVFSPGPAPARCWPHHFDIATLVPLEEGDPEHARTVGIGVSPGDEHYAQPYAYVSPGPPLSPTDLPSAPSPGHWHTQGFVGIVATGEAIVALPDRQAFQAFLMEAFEVCRARLGR